MAPDDIPTASTLLRAFGQRAKRTLGQNFLVDPSILGRIVEQSGAEPGESVLEVGPGPGTLTRTLLAHGCRVVAVELDDRAVSHLQEHLGPFGLTVVHGDALRIDLDALLTEPIRVVANLPYNAATEIFFRLDAQPRIVDMSLMFQREVAQRFVAGPGTKAYGVLSILAGIRWTPEIVIKLPPGAFIPRPKVYSALVRFRRLTEPAIDPALEPRLRTLVRTAFQQRRKTIRNALKPLVGVAELEASGIDPGRRPETIGLDAFVALCRGVATVTRRRD